MDLYYDKSTSAVVAVVDHKVKLVADFGKSDFQHLGPAMAAAPDLLEEVKVALQCAEVGLVPDATTQARFRAAIAKAVTP